MRRLATIAATAAALLVGAGTGRAAETDESSKEIKRPAERPAATQSATTRPRIATRWVNPADKPFYIGNNLVPAFDNEKHKMPLRVQHKVIDSKAMKRKMGYTIYLPPDYKTSKKRYPVLYFLHGGGGNEWMYWENLARRKATAETTVIKWNEIELVEASSFFDDLIAAGKIPPLIVVAINGGRGSGYADSPQTGAMVETYFLSELIPHVDETYRTIPKRQGRAIEGFSMGAGGTMRFAFGHPELFSSAIIYAGGIRGGDDNRTKALEQNLENVRGKVQIRVVIGGKDRGLNGARNLRSLLSKMKVPHEFDVLPGVPHQYFQYHRDAGEKGLLFHAKALWKAYNR